MITTEQENAIKFFNNLMHPSVLAALVANGSRDGWMEINYHISELLKLLPKETPSDSN